MGDQSALLTQLVATGAQVALAVVLARLLGAVLLGAAARALASRWPSGRSSGRSSRPVVDLAGLAARAALRLSPRCTRRAVAAIAGAGLALALSGPAVATAGAHRPSAVPVLDRVIAPLLEGGSAGWREPSERRRPEPVAAHHHRVRPGDSLWSVAADALGPAATPTQVARSWPRWFDRNRAVIGPDPALLVPGQLLRPPTAGTDAR